jgi:hypothetical protein
MKATRFWVANGIMRRVDEGAAPLTAQEERKSLESGEVRLTTGEIGTELKWHVQTPCVASLFVIIDWLRGAHGPYVLRFFASGWFEEFYTTASEAAVRIDAIISRGDRHFPVRTFVQKVETREKSLSSLIQHCLTTTHLPEDYLVDCTFEHNTERFVVDRVGPRSLMGRLYGQSDNSFAHQSTGSFSEAVSEGYREVLTTGRPRTDHVLAALRLSNNQVHWVPYHRLILPQIKDGRTYGVKVVADAAKINFKVI